MNEQPTTPASVRQDHEDDIVLLSTADWDNPFWTNKQHVAVELARRGHRVLYIDSLGLRRPSASAQDLRRIAGRLRKALRRPQQVRDRLWVWSPLVVPFQRWRVVRALNRLLLDLGLRFWMWRLRLRPDIFWTYNPMTPRLVDTSRFGRLVYHCVDEIKAQPGMPAQDIEHSEQELTAGADICFVTAEHLLATRRALNPATHYFPNVADFEHFQKALSADTLVPADLAALPAPRIGFVGAISGYKIDFPLLRHVAERHPDWSIVLIGKVGEGDPWTDTSSVRDLSNLHLVGPRDYADLPAYLKGFDVAVLPSLLNEYTRGMFPMKFFEYLAAGRPVVATQLHALRGYGHVAMLANDTDAFVRGIEEALAGKVPPLAERLEAAREQTYERRTARMLRLIQEGPTG